MAKRDMLTPDSVYLNTQAGIWERISPLVRVFFFVEIRIIMEAPNCCVPVVFFVTNKESSTIPVQVLPSPE